jgi:hypothetical protein
MAANLVVAVDGAKERTMTHEFQMDAVDNPAAQLFT